MCHNKPILHDAAHTCAVPATPGCTCAPASTASTATLLTPSAACRLFIEFVFESIPQTVLQTYIYHQLSKSHLAGGARHAAAAPSNDTSSSSAPKLRPKAQAHATRRAAHLQLCSCAVHLASVTRASVVHAQRNTNPGLSRL